MDDIGEPLNSKAARRQERKRAKAEKQARRSPKPIEARTPRQREYIISLKNNSLTFATGPAGVGKTYVPSRVYGEMLLRGEIGKIYIARPNIAKAKHRMGFLPGSAEEKMAPWLVPILEGIKDSMSPSEFDGFMRNNTIEVVPYEFIQGRTFRDAACIIDEAENLDLDDLYITLTRQGDNLYMALCGDIRQARIPDCGLQTVIDMVFQHNMEDVGVVEFSEEDVVRSAQARQWVFAFNNRPNLNSSSDYDKEHDELRRTPFLRGHE